MYRQIQELTINLIEQGKIITFFFTSTVKNNIVEILVIIIVNISIISVAINQYDIIIIKLLYRIKFIASIQKSKNNTML